MKIRAKATMKKNKKNLILTIYQKIRVISVPYQLNWIPELKWKTTSSGAGKRST